MKQKRILLAILILMMASCQSKKAANLKTVFEQKDRAVFNVMVGKNGPSDRKLACLTMGDYKCALREIDAEERAFDKIIGEINALRTGDIKHGNELKTAAANYYTAVKELEISERLTIAQQLISQDKANTEAVRDAATHKQLQLSKDKMEMHKIISKKEQLYADAKKLFNSANHLD